MCVLNSFSQLKIQFHSTQKNQNSLQVTLFSEMENFLIINMTDETQLSPILMKVKLLNHFYQQRNSSFLGQCSATISNH